jgi:dTDP-glucose 4,6-dehydratase
MKKIVITGGCGFIGSHITEYFFKKYKNSRIVIIDKITYAASLENLINIKKEKRVKVYKEDILNFKRLKEITSNADLVIHAAAESHVDNSFQLNDDFVMTNVLGTKNVMQACKENKVKKILHISTDEIYGEIFSGSFNENNRFNPSNPYSSSKAAAEMIVNGYIHSYKLPVILVRANNIFGTRQHPEKLISGCCWSFIKNKKFTIHGKGLQKRTFLYVEDLCRALEILVKVGKLYNAYNVGSPFEYRNIDIVKIIANQNNKDLKKNTTFVEDRPFNDFRYSINYNKIKKLGWKPSIKVEDKIEEINNWYKNNITRFKKRFE